MILSQIPFQLNKAQIEKDLHLEQFLPFQQEVIQRYLLEGLTFIEAKGIIERKPADQLDIPLLGLEESQQQTIKNADSANLLLATIGKQLEKEIEIEINKGNHLKSIVYHAIGVASVHQAMHYIQQIITRKSQQQGHQLSKRIAPGYDGWKIENQASLLQMLAGDKIDVSITKDYILTPIYTLTGIVFEYKETKVPVDLPYKNSCQTCTVTFGKTKCDYKIYCQKA